MQNFNIPQLIVIAQQIDTDSLKTTFRNAYLVLDTHNNELIIDFNITNSKCFDTTVDSTYYYQLVIYYDIMNSLKLWTINLTVNDLEHNDFFLEKNSEYKSLQQFLQNYLLHEKLQDKLKIKPSVRQKKI